MPVYIQAVVLRLSWALAAPLSCDIFNILRCPMPVYIQAVVLRLSWALAAPLSYTAPLHVRLGVLTPRLLFAASLSVCLRVPLCTNTHPALYICCCVQRLEVCWGACHMHAGVSCLTVGDTRLGMRGPQCGQLFLMEHMKQQQSSNW